MKALVLLSGGLDSTASLLWSLRAFSEVHAVFFLYGQPQADAERYAARALCERRNVAISVIHMGETVRGNRAIVVPPAGRVDGVSRANLHGRNGLFLFAAAAEARRLWPVDPFDLVIGCNRDDAEAFPDCRPGFLAAVEGALQITIGEGVRVKAPWGALPKSEIVRWCAQAPGFLADAHQSTSCYRGDSCGTCDACELRGRSFAAVGVKDIAHGLVICGGDPHRERKA